ncbi:MAG: TRAP transporter large permease subunit [Aquabacterium sp.]|nr:TRAP transporter large permease subunit [Aquabacterium sp.]
MHNTPSRSLMGRTLIEWFSSLPVFIMLMLTLIIGTGEMVHGQLLKFGESMFGNPATQVQYFMLRAEPVKPECNASIDIEAEVQRQLNAPASASSDDIDDLFGNTETVTDPVVLRKSIEQAQAICQAKHSLYERVLALQTPQVQMYRTIETSFFGLFKIGTENRSLILLLMVGIAAITTTLGRHHISIRPALYTRDHQAQTWSQVFANGFLLFSCVRYYQILQGTGGVPKEEVVLHWIWMALFTVMLLINVVRIVRPLKSEEGQGTWGAAMLAVPLYANMGIIAGVYFLLTNHDAGLAIYINQLMALPSIFMNLALFIWAGMLLKQSRIVDLLLDVIRPWSLSPQLLTYLILLGASFATAYTGASGIFVIAAGGVIYHEVRAAGGTRHFALAATAMSGSLGVVLRPCLLIVMIAALNKEVTTNGLYHWGFYVFLLTSTLFFLVSQLLRKQRAAIESPAVAIPAMLRKLIPVLPYALVTVIIIMIYEHGLDTALNEITAPTIMPIILLLILIYDKMTNKGKAELTPDYASHRQEGIERSVRFATTESIGHVGALMSLMTLSLAIGGIIERSEIVHMFPQVFETPWHAMAVLALIMVFLGMVMDPLGAIVLVSGTLAPIAYVNQIDRLHFWMMVLVSFELSYLSPLVALNQLLTRQVIGEDEVNLADSEVRHLGFYARYERWILPVVVMLMGLLIVAFGPLLAQHVDAFAFLKDIVPMPTE